LQSPDDVDHCNSSDIRVKKNDYNVLLGAASRVTGSREAPCGISIHLDQE
jgi:hypothetical protein